MKTILVYDYDENRLQKLADANDLSIADIVEELITEYLDLNELD